MKNYMSIYSSFKSEITDENWKHFAREEEYQDGLIDKYGRFPYFSSHNENIFEPEISRFFVKYHNKITYPDNKSFAVCLTHDIDVVYRSLTERSIEIMRLLKNKNKNQNKINIKHLINKKIPYWNLHEIMELESKYNAKSSFYFLALNPDDLGYSYDINDLKEELREIDKHGCEVGLHGSHSAYDSYETLCIEKKRLEDVFGKEVVGYRNHFLRFKVPDTWENLARAGFLYDTTLGYADCVGFRNGMCHPFYPYNLNTGKSIDIIEIPLVVMDCTLFDTYMRLTKEDALSLILQLIDKVAELNGVFTLLWHNTYLIEGSWEKEMYEKILSYCNEKNAWMTSGKEICEWYLRNSYE